MVSIRVASYLKEVAGFREKVVDLNKPTKIRDLISFPNIPDERIVVLINEKGGKLDYKVFGDDKVLLLPVVGGG